MIAKLYLPEPDVEMAKAAAMDAQAIIYVKGYIDVHAIAPQI